MASMVLPSAGIASIAADGSIIHASALLSMLPPFWREVGVALIESHGADEIRLQIRSMLSAAFALEGKDAEAALQALIDAELRADRFVVVTGWTLPRSEALLCAHAVLVRV